MTPLVKRGGRLRAMRVHQPVDCDLLMDLQDFFYVHMPDLLLHDNRVAEGGLVAVTQVNKTWQFLPNHNGKKVKTHNLVGVCSVKLSPTAKQCKI